MIKRKRNGSYKCKLLIRALNAEAKLKMLNEAHIKCCKSRDERIYDLEQSSEVQNMIIGIAVKRAEKECFKITQEELTGEKDYAVIVSSDDEGNIKLTRVARRDIEGAAETQQE